MSEEDFREGLPTKEQIEAHYEPGKPYGYWRRKGDPRAFRLGWHNDEVVYDCTPWRSSDRLMPALESLCSSAWQPADSSNNLLPWSVVMRRQISEAPLPIYKQKFFMNSAHGSHEIYVTLPEEKKIVQIDISKLSTEDRAQLRRQLDAAEPPTFNSALRSGLEHAPIELALDRAHALLDRAVDTLWAAGSEDDKATVRRFFRDALKSEYGKAGMAFGAGALLPHAADAAGALLPSESNAPRYLNRAAWLFTERGATIVAREIGSTAIDSIGPLIGTLRMLLADLVNGMRTAEAGIAGLLPAASRPLNFDAVPKPETVEK